VSVLTFIIDCPICKAKVGAEEKGRIFTGWMDDSQQPNGTRLLIGTCPRCNTALAGTCTQIHFEGIDSEDDEWSDVERVYPSPPKAFTSYRIPRIVTNSLSEAEKSIQVGAHMAACVMFGRALEGVCRDVLKVVGKKLMLGAGIKQLHDRKIIDDRLLDWAEQLQVFRNISAHPDEDFTVSRADAEDLQAFVHAIIEYVYDLTDRYEEFKERLARRAARNPAAQT
jgi:hypothetical protein